MRSNPEVQDSGYSEASLQSRLKHHLERRKRLDEELERVRVDMERLGKAETASRWWLSLRHDADRSSAAESVGGGLPLSAVTIVVPVYNAHDELRECLHSLARFTTYPCELLLIDDASDDPQIGALFELAAGLSGVRALRNAENMGFTATVNRAIRSCTGDVVLLNSDTTVGPRWLEHFVQAANRAPDIGSITPVSDNAGAFSVPEPDRLNSLPPHLSVPDVARLLSSHGCADLAPTPTAGGFCMYIKRALIDDVGEFDAEHFPRGYGEENDFSMRALHRGWRHVVDGRIFVHHERESSFGVAKAKLAATARSTLARLHPDYGRLVREFMTGPEIGAIRAAAEEALKQADAEVRPRLLFVIHEGSGGAVATNLDLMGALEDEFEPFVFSSDRKRLRLQRFVAGRLVELREWPLDPPLLLGHFSRPDYRTAFRQALDSSRPDLVHIRHLFKHTLDAPKLAAAQAIPIVMSIHDHYTLCPTIHLLDNEGNYCGGVCSPSHGVCQTLVKAGPLPPLKHSFVYQWREEMEAALRHVDAFVTTSPHTREVHRQLLAPMHRARFDVIEHGRDLPQATGLASPPAPGGRIRILVAGNLDRHKGADLIRQVRELDVEDRLELHFLGFVPQAFQDLGVMHGSYRRGDFIERVGEVRPAFIGIFSIVAETYNHSLTEAWAAGIPALVTDIGALGERVRSHGGGFLVPLGDPAASLRAIYEAADNPERYRQETDRATLRGIPSTSRMGEQYADLYRDVVDSRRVITAPSQATGEPLGRGVWRMTAVVPGRFPSTYVRILRRYNHPEVEWKLRMRTRMELENLALQETDVVLVQRHAVAPAQAHEFIEELRRNGVPLVLDLDDHLLASEYGDFEHFADRAEPLRLLLDAAALVTVSTPTLAETIAPLTRRVVVLPNHLDERLFLTGTRGEPPAPQTNPDGPVRLAFAGSPGHADDLGFLRTVLERLEQERPGQFSLDVVGGEPRSETGTWYRRLDIPSDRTGYPDYVALLRGWRPQWDIAVAPLLDTPFNRNKSDLKYLEYSGLGLPGIFSDVEPYASVRNEETGLVVGNGVDEWASAIERLADDLDLRERIRHAAWSHVTGHRLLRQNAGQVLELIGSVVSGSRQAPGDSAPGLSRASVSQVAAAAAS